MRSILLSFFIALLSLQYANAFDVDENEKDRIVKKMDKQVVCWNNGDIPCFMQYYWQSDSLKFVGKNGITYGWQNTLNRYLEKYPDKKAMGQLAFKIIHVEDINDGMILVTGSWKLEKETEEVGGYYTLIWKKIDNKWFIIYDHTS